MKLNLSKLFQDSITFGKQLQISVRLLMKNMLECGLIFGKIQACGDRNKSKRIDLAWLYEYPLFGRLHGCSIKAMFNRSKNHKVYSRTDSKK
jgi:hypothetical protein